MILVNTPNNPGTGILSADDLRHFADVTRGTGIVIVSDEVYEHMVYDGARHESLARSDELAARSVVIGSFGKTFHATGWKVGYTLAPREITAEIRRVHQFTVFTVNSAVQHGLAAFLARAVALRGAPRILHRQARPAPRGAGRHAARSAACRGSYFQLATLRAHQRRARGGIRAAAGARIRRGDHTAVGVLPGRNRSPRDPFLLRQARRDDFCGGGAPASFVTESCRRPPSPRPKGRLRLQ